MSLPTIQLNQLHNQLTIFSNSQLYPKIQYLQENNKIVIDLPDAIFPPVHQTIQSPHQGIERIRISQYENNPPKVRLVYDLKDNILLNIRNEKITDTRFQLSVQPHFKMAQNPGSTGGQLQQLTDLSIQNNNLVLEGTGPLNPEIRQSKHDSKRYYVILYNVESRLTNRDEISSKFIENVQIESKNKRTIIAFDLRQQNLEIIPFREGNITTIQFFVRTQSENTSKIENVEVIDMSHDVTRVRIYANKPFDYEVYPLTNPERLVLDTLGTKMTSGPGERAIISNILKKIRFGFLSQTQNSNARIVFDLKEDVSYQYNTSSDGRVLEIMLHTKHNMVKANQRVFIVLDAGHGGNDPGAIGPTGAQEKNVVLGVTRLLQRYLENDNFKVMLTRGKDDEILLQPRVDVANNRNADLFISIHANAMPKGHTDTRGIETYYTTPQSLELARVLHQHMLKELKTPDRGVRKRRLFVTRKTSMPSVLLEIGFISNDIDEKLLANPGYQRRIARAIYEGIHQYLLLQEKKSTPLKL